MITLKKNLNHSDKELKDHIQQVISVYHEQFKEDCQRIIKEFDNACLSRSCANLHHAKDLFHYLTQKLNFHLVVEENIVFPMMLNNRVSERLDSIIQTMEAEHLEDALIIKDIIKVLNLAEQNDAVKILLSELEIFQAHFKEHTHYEDEYVFKP